MPQASACPSPAGQVRTAPDRRIGIPMDLVGVPADACAEYPFGAVALRVRVVCAVTHGHEGGRRRSLRRARSPAVGSGLGRWAVLWEAVCRRAWRVDVVDVGMVPVAASLRG